MKPILINSGGFRIPEFGKKSGLTAIRSRDANILVKCLNALGQMTVARGNTNGFIYSDGNIVLTLKNISDGESFGGDSATVQVYRYKSQQGDYVVCRTWDGSTEGDTDVAIAKPMKLRNSITSATIDGVGVTYSYGASKVERTATIGAVTEDQVIVPRYLVNDLIFATSSTGGTGVSGQSKIDLNVDGRAWAKKNV